ncbi:hypothetical protein VMT65_11665 [Nocardia sp. CDC153]|uniref:hypothetical protein n=1 Tax=Nocardia sp. CDC153 TaxID=3112167 RepID=UPI002DBFDF7E|nr:hypothetical protein [Nocardia sp. CDC153]MEC3953692.1 hypothetical protein [Nocardia sp. CDC153]
MIRQCAAAVPLLAALVCGCTISTSEVHDAGNAATGLAPGVTLYYLDAQGALVPEFRDVGNLGSMADALDLLLRTPPGLGLQSQLPADSAARRPAVSEIGTEITIEMPYPAAELTAPAVSQLACTVLGVHRQSGGKLATVRIVPSIGETIGPRGCPLLR